VRFWDRALFLGLAVVDKLFGSHLVQREMERRQKHLAICQAQVTNIQHKIDDLETQLTGLHLQLCLVYLRQRYMMDLDNWLRFETGGDDERGLDLLIEYLVKPRLAAIEMDEIAPRHHVYYLRPDWTAIAVAIGDTPETLELETFVWLQQRVASQYQPTT
jgi:hypothetical protein